jgi:hypothetical protein
MRIPLPPPPSFARPSQLGVQHARSLGCQSPGPSVPLGRALPCPLQRPANDAQLTLPKSTACRSTRASVADRWVAALLLLAPWARCRGPSSCTRLRAVTSHQHCETRPCPPTTRLVAAIYSLHANPPPAVSATLVHAHFTSPFSPRHCICSAPVYARCAA